MLPLQGLAQAPALVPVEPLGLRVASGFTVNLFSDPSQAGDITAMTLNAQGDVVVSGPGYIRILLDENEDGIAEEVVDFAAPSTGASALCWVNASLYACAEGWLVRYDDADTNNVADGPPERLLPLATGGHGGQGIRRGPDGLLYVVGGNDVQFTERHTRSATSPVTAIEGGALLRMSLDGVSTECLAHGFRNPAGIDFNPAGDLFTADSDLSADAGLPWYTPSRLFHIAFGGHHGWRLSGAERSWSRPAYYADAVDSLAPLGVGAPSAVTCYRHYQFPPRYRGGLFFADWLHGRILFSPLLPAGGTYAAVPEVFLESVGIQGFAPTDLAVAPDGSLLVATGGSRMRGSVYRIRFPGAGVLGAAGGWRGNAITATDLILITPQPSEAWSRAEWQPLAVQAGRIPFDAVAGDNGLAVDLRVRAIEILTELYQGLEVEGAAACARAAAPAVRARTAWSLGLTAVEGVGGILLDLTRDAEPQVRVTALNAFAARAQAAEADVATQAVLANLGHPDKRVRQAAAYLARRLPEAAWQRVWDEAGDSQGRLTASLALVWRHNNPSPPLPVVDAALAALRPGGAAGERLQAARLLMLAFGDWRIRNPSRELYSGYELVGAPAPDDPLTGRIRNAVRPIFPSGDPVVDLELVRLLAMFADDAPEMPGKILAQTSDRTTAETDVHYLVALSKLGIAAPASQRDRVIRTLLGLDRKLRRDGVRVFENWPVRVQDLARALLDRDQGLAEALLKNPEFPRPPNVRIAQELGERQAAAAALMLNAAQGDPTFPVTIPLLDLLETLPAETVQPWLRRQWTNTVMRDDIVIRLARSASELDQDKFLVGLGSDRPETVRAALWALLRLPPDPSGKALFPAVRLLRKTFQDLGAAELRADIMRLVQRSSGEQFSVREDATDLGTLARSYQPVFAWFSKKHPDLARVLVQPDTPSQAHWLRQLPTIPWDKGVIPQGEAIFRARGCATCHAGPDPIGPDLALPSHRLSPTELLMAIIHPSRSIADPFRTTTLQMRDGRRYTGFLVYESGGIAMVVNGASTSLRLNSADIVQRHYNIISIMPDGLLNGASAIDPAHLRTYLRSQQPR